MSDVALRPERLDCISLCTGGGGLDLGVELALPGARAVCLVEREAFAVAHLVEAMRAGLLAPAPVWSDARTFRGRRWRGLVDGVFGGIPCQPHSEAGKRLGAEDERDLWSDARRIFVQSGAWWFLIENVSGMLSSGGAERVWRDLHRLGCSVEVGLFTAREVGPSHERARLFILGVADTKRDGRGQSPQLLQPRAGQSEPALRGEDLADTYGDGQLRRAELHLRSIRPEQRASRRDHLERRDRDVGDADGSRTDAHPAVGGSRTAARQPSGPMVDTLGGGCDRRPDEPVRGPQGRTAAELSGEGPLFAPGPGDRDAWRAILEHWPYLEPAVRRAPDGLADGLDPALLDRVERLRMLGNGVVPLAAAYAIRTLATRLAARSAGAAELVRLMGAA